MAPLLSEVQSYQKQDFEICGVCKGPIIIQGHAYYKNSAFENSAIKKNVDAYYIEQKALILCSECFQNIKKENIQKELFSDIQKIQQELQQEVNKLKDEIKIADIEYKAILAKLEKSRDEQTLIKKFDLEQLVRTFNCLREIKTQAEKTFKTEIVSSLQIFETFKSADQALSADFRNSLSLNFKILFSQLLKDFRRDVEDCLQKDEKIKEVQTQILLQYQELFENGTMDLNIFSGLVKENSNIRKISEKKEILERLDLVKQKIQTQLNHNEQFEIQ